VFWALAARSMLKPLSQYSIFFVQTSDVARPKAGQAKTTFSRPRLLFKGHQIINPRPLA